VEVTRVEAEVVDEIIKSSGSSNLGRCSLSSSSSHRCPWSFLNLVPLVTLNNLLVLFQDLCLLLGLSMELISSSFLTQHMVSSLTSALATSISTTSSAAAATTTTCTHWRRHGKQTKELCQGKKKLGVAQQNSPSVVSSTAAQMSYTNTICM
jgi:hypothetical protein